ncbi:hypothetical protein KQI84_07815 [bacterium]|nr:hypothetical protein [bacterium]
MKSTRFVALICTMLLLHGLLLAQQIDPAAIRQVAEERLLQGVAAYPDEVAAAILQVAQDPAALAAGKAPDSASGQAAYKYLEQYPGVLDILKQNPASTAALGQYAKKSGTQIWDKIDAVRQDMNITKSVENQANPLKGTASQVRQGVVEINDKAVGQYEGATNVVKDRQGDISSQSAGQASVGGGNRWANASHEGTTNYNPNEQSANSQHAVNYSDSAGRSGQVQQSSQSAATEDGYTRQGSGSATTNKGSGAWNRTATGTRTQTGARVQSQTHVQTGSGTQVDVDHTTDIEQTNTGYDVTHSGSATSSSGQSADWQRETSATQTDDGLALQFSRPTGSASGFSMQNMDAAAMNQTMQRAMNQQRQAFQSQEQKLSGAGMNRSSAPSFSPQQSIEKKASGSRGGGNSSGNRGGNSSRGGSGGGRGRR